MAGGAHAALGSHNRRLIETLGTLGRRDKSACSRKGRVDDVGVVDGWDSRVALIDIVLAFELF